MAEKNTRWENDKEWAGWTLRDEIYAFVRAHLQPIISGAVGGAMGAIIAAIKSYPTVAASIGAVVLTLAVITILAIKDGRKRNRRAETKVTESTARLPSVLREEINFNYLPDPLTKHGWRQGYASNVIPTDAVWKAATEFPGGMSMALSDLGCAIDYPLTAGAVLSKRIVCDFKSSATAMIFVRVKLATRDGSKPEEGFIKFEIRGGLPRWVPKYHEWELPIDPPPLGNGWHHLDIDLVDAVNRTWGQDGWCLRELDKIRLRGELSISPIRLY
jgi:hypothetical protein